MKNRKSLVLVLVLAIDCGHGGGHRVVEGEQEAWQTGNPGGADSRVCRHDHFGLPERVPGFTSTNLPEDPVVLGWLPKDTSYAQRLYESGRRALCRMPT